MGQRGPGAPRAETGKERPVKYNQQTQLLKTLNARNLPAKYVDFSTAHVYMLELDQWQRANMEAHPDYMGMLKSYSATGPAITALHKGKPVLSFGVVPLWPGVSEAWMLRGEAVSDHGRAVAHGARLFFDQIGPICGLWRCQIGVQTSNERATRFAEYLKFKVEGLMEQFGPEGSDFFMMARLYNGRNVQQSETPGTRPRNRGSAEGPGGAPGETGGPRNTARGERAA